MQPVHFRYWHIASFRCAAEFGRYRGIAELASRLRGRFGFWAWSDVGFFSRSLGLKYQEILPRQEWMGRDKCIAGGFEFRGYFFGWDAVFRRWPLRRIRLEIHDGQPSIRTNDAFNLEK